MARYFDGGNDYSVAAGQYYNNDNQVCVALWVKVPTGHGNVQYDRIFELGGYDRGDNTESADTHSGGIGLEFHDPTSQVYSAIWQDDGDLGYPGTFEYTLDTWFHVVITSNAVGPANNVHYNGGAASSDNTKIRSIWADQFSLGGRNDSPADNEGQCFVAELAIWHGVILSQSEVEALAKGYSPLFISPQYLVGYWPHVRGSATVEYDRIQGHNLTVTNAIVSQHPPIIYPAMPQIITVPAAGVIYERSITYGSTMNMTVTSQGEFYRAIFLGAQAGFQAASQGEFFNVIQFAAQAGYTATAGMLLYDAVIFGAQLGYTLASLVHKEGSISLDVSMDQQLASQIVAQSQITLGTQMQITLAAQAIFESAITLALNAGILKEGSIAEEYQRSVSFSLSVAVNFAARMLWEEVTKPSEIFAKSDESAGGIWQQVSKPTEIFQESDEQVIAGDGFGHAPFGHSPFGWDRIFFGEEEPSGSWKEKKN